MIDRLFYLSNAAQPFEPEDLEQLSERAQAANQKAKITGILVHLDDRFLQYIEGPVRPLEDLFERIGRDPRHRVLRSVRGEAQDRREFPDWSMELVGKHDVLATGLQAVMRSPTIEFGTPTNQPVKTTDLLRRWDQVAWTAIRQLGGLTAARASRRS